MTTKWKIIIGGDKKNNLINYFLITVYKDCDTRITFY